MTNWRSYLDTHQETYLDQLLELLRIPSISQDPACAADVARAAEWVAERLRRAGIESAEVLATNGHPVVYGEWLNAPSQPTVLLYGHFDVQPADPLEAWHTPPFEPALRDGRVYARGAADSKGNLLVAIAAVEAWLQAEGTLPVNVKFLFEGEEEIGSRNLPKFVRAHRARLACDIVINSDSLQWSESQPALLIGLRGVCGGYLTVEGASSDLHSGLYGGTVPNALHALASLLASLHDAAGRVAVEGFYDHVTDLSPEERAQLATVPFDEAAFRGEVGVTELVGEAGYTPHERLWARPTLEVVGMWGGYQGEGLKTIVPHVAHAKLTCRLVPDQDPSHVLDRIAAHIDAHTPMGVKVTFKRSPATARPYLMPADHPANVTAAGVLQELYGQEPYFIRFGGTVGVVPLFLQELDAYSLSFGFGLPDEHFHAPNEFFRLVSFERGQRAFGLLLERLARRV